MYYDMQCPYCGADDDVCHDDGAGYAEDEAHQHWCGHCEKTYVFQTSIDFSYEPSKADCLNTDDDLHDWKHIDDPWYPQKKICRVCEESSNGERASDEDHAKELIRMARIVYAFEQAQKALTDMCKEATESTVLGGPTFTRGQFVKFLSKDGGEG